MRGRSLCLVVIGSLVATGALLGGDNEAVLKKLQGTWKFVSQEMDGKEAPKDKLAKMTITFEGDKWTVRDGDKVAQAGTHKFDPSKKPVQVDAKVTEGESKGSTMLGIAEWKGDNTMRVCFDPKGKERPKTFDSKDGRFVAVVEREKKK